MVVLRSLLPVAARLEQACLSEFDGGAEPTSPSAPPPDELAGDWAAPLPDGQRWRRCTAREPKGAHSRQGRTPLPGPRTVTDNPPTLSRHCPGSKSPGNDRGPAATQRSRRVVSARCLSAALLGALTLASAGAGIAAGPVLAAATPPASWPYPNGTLANTRVAPDTAISAANVAQLRRSWSFPILGRAAKGIGAYGSLAATPIVEDGVVYLQDLYANVYALSLATGHLLWQYRQNSPLTRTLGPDGVAVSGGVVYGDSPTTAFALKASTGRPIWVDRHLLGGGQGTFGIQPQVAGGRVYLASAVGSGSHGGVLLAVRAATGALLWKFNTLRRTKPGVAAAGGAWETPLVGTDGSVTYGTGNPYQSAQSAIGHPAALAYTDSAVNLDAATGRLRWYYQAVPDDFKDYDLQTSPIGVTIGNTAAVIGSGKMGEVYAINSSDGQLIWKTPVGKHNGHDQDSERALDHHSRLKAPFTFLPGSLGGVLSNLAVADGSVFVATVDLPFRFTSLGQVAGVNVGAPSHAKATGELEALNLTTGQVEWDTKVSQMPLGGMTVANDLVFATLYDGELLALNPATGAVVFQRRLPTSTNSTIAVVGSTVLIPCGGPKTGSAGGHPQLVAYSLPAG